MHSFETKHLLLATCEKIKFARVHSELILNMKVDKHIKNAL